MKNTNNKTICANSNSQKSTVKTPSSTKYYPTELPYAENPSKIGKEIAEKVFQENKHILTEKKK